MTVVVTSMAMIMLTAVGVLLAVFVMHVITRSPRARLKIRRAALTVGAAAYAVRREIAQRVRLAGRYAGRYFEPPAPPVGPRDRPGARGHSQGPSSERTTR
ncbi:MAG TPA: hypothetical protein VFY84_13550 [Jiangellales bacterium]|nr:hypothetical protein [Jiangellales bacterium]